MFQQVTVFGAFFAGLLSFLSPCVLPLVPPYLGYLAGASLQELTGAGSRDAASRRIFFSALAFVLGFSTVFVLLGASASMLGQFVARHLQVLGYVAGVLIIMMGLHFLGLFRIPLLYREVRLHVERKPAGLLGAYVIGLAFAFGWTPCIGPILAAILAVAGSEQSIQKGSILLMSYALGLGIPFLVTSLFAAPFLKMMARFRRYMGLVEKAMGIVLVLTGIMFLTGSMASLSYWLLDTFPQFGTLG